MLAPPFLGLRVKGDDRIQGASCAHLGSPSLSLDLKNSSIGDDSSHVGNLPLTVHVLLGISWVTGIIADRRVLEEDGLPRCAQLAP